MVQESAAMDVEVASPFIGVDQNHEQRVSSLKRKLKRKLSCGQSLDQYDCKFGIRLDAQGDVVLMSDESEISSLDEADVGRLREHYENVQKHEVSDEVQLQRDQQIRELEAVLRIEEAKLLMMKKLRHSQLHHDEKMLDGGGNAASVRRLAPLQNSSGQAYKPKVAVASNQHKKDTNSSNNQKSTAKLNGATAPQHMSGDKKGGNGAAKSSVDATGGMQGLANVAVGGIQLSTLPPQHLSVIQQLYERLSQNPQQMAGMIKTLPPQTGQALTELLRQYAVAQTTSAASQQTQKSSQQKQQHSTAAAPTSQSHDARELTQQNISKARQQLRRDLDQLIAKLPVPKAPLPDLSFIPNGGTSQPEFVYLLGLDLTVQRVLKDRQMFKKSDIPPYRCEECDTDFTPSWKAICGDNEEYHLYCERCVRLAQKRKVCLDYKALLNRAFQQIKEREKEFERHVASGKYNVDPVLPLPTATVPSSAASAQKSATESKLTKSQQQSNNAAMTSSNHQKDGFQSIAPPIQHLTTSQQPTALNLSMAAAPANVPNTLANPAKTVQNHAKTGASTSCNSGASTSSSKRGVTSARTASTISNSGNNTAAMASNAAAAASNPLAAVLQQNPIMQQHLAAMAASPIFRQLGHLASNPVMLATLAQNPMLVQQLFAAMTAQHQQQQQQQQQRTQPTIASTPINVPSGAAHALAQIAQKSSQQLQQQTQQQHHRASTVTTSSTAPHSSTHHSASNVSASAASNQQQPAQLATLAAAMNSAANPFLQNLSQNPQLLTQLTSNPQFRQVMQQMIQQQMIQQAKGGPSTSSGSGKK
uniref:Transcriptional repressor p66 coiled-coil MBD2-interaction domain-containing protein n=1 Tax=Meloidogyne incognita TaxID=6306 RepID=A0A914LK37_MELIC